MLNKAFFCIVLVAGASALGACGSRSDENDNGVKPDPNPIGGGVHIRDVVNPTKNSNGQTVNISGAVVLTIDTYDETANGKSAGTVYVQDIGSQAPFSGTNLYSPSFVPSDLRVVPGDTLDLLGQYVIESSIGSAAFSAGQGLPQVSKPTATFRYEYQTPAPLLIDPTDLGDYTKGYQWENMLVTVQNVTVYDGLTNDAGRVTGHITPDFTSNPDAPTISNELTPLDVNSIPVGTKFKSITGIVTWFFSYHIAPRSQADLVLAD
jgi:hypothetical protein